MKRIPIIYFHSVAPEKNPIWIKSHLTFKLSYFEALIRYLWKKNFAFITLDEYFTLSEKSANDRKVICLTFDDGYLDNYVFVYPILKKHKAIATIFVSPEYVQEGEEIRPTLEDVWSGRMPLQKLKTLGFASWRELKTMQESGIIDVQSHGLTHTKYYVSQKIREFHHPQSDYLHPIANQFPTLKPYYMTDSGFIHRIPWGTPFFEEMPAIVAKRVWLNDIFTLHCTEMLNDMDWLHYSHSRCLEKVRAEYNHYEQNRKLIVHKETRSEYEDRVTGELMQSKRIIEKKLAKPVHHCCWPNGAYNDFSHQRAIEIGYRSTAVVLPPGEITPERDRFDRTGSEEVLRSLRLTMLKQIYKIQSTRGVFPYHLIRFVYNHARYGKFK